MRRIEGAVLIKFGPVRIKQKLRLSLSKISIWIERYLVRPILCREETGQTVQALMTVLLPRH